MEFKSFLSLFLVFILSGCAANNGPDEIKVHANATSAKNKDLLNAVTGSSLSGLLILPIMNSVGKSFFANMLIKNEHSHLDSTDALLSSLKDPYYKYNYKNQELWIYLDVVGTTHDFISNIYFLIEDKKIIELYTKLVNVPNAKKFEKDKNYLDPLKKYR